MIGSSTGRAPSWLSLAPALVLIVAAFVRFRHYDVAWFGLDQIYFMAEARRVLAGHFDVVGPLASGLNIIGPLYSYLLAGLLWIREDPAFLVLFNVICEIGAACLVYDIGRRLSGSVFGLVAAASYITAPVLVISTRLIWNPSLLPALVVLGWWFVVRYVQRPSTATLAAVALTSGLALTLHATGIFQAAGFVTAAFLTRSPSLKQLIVAVCAGLLPLVPVLARLGGGGGDAAALGTRIAMSAEPVAVARGIAQMVLTLPQAFGQHWSITLSTIVLHLQAVVAALGLASGLLGGGPFRSLWLGMAVSLIANLASAFFYTGSISWHYFIALVPMACLCVGQAAASLPPRRMWPAAVAVSMAASHVLFVSHFDRQAITAGLIQVDAGRVGLRTPSVIGYSPTLRELQKIGHALRDVAPDGSTAMLIAHGARGELWRETGGEFLPRAEGPRYDWATEFLVTGAGATPLMPSARVLDERVCAFKRSSNLSWKVLHAPPASGWESLGFDDTGWFPVSLPRRVTRPSLAGPFPPLATWRAPQTLLRGRLIAERVDSRQILSMVIHGTVSSGYWVTAAFVNGQPLPVTRERVFLTTMSLNQEWLFDLTGRLQVGENVIAFAFDGQLPVFDLDVFEVPCLDTEWYF